jgi:hypothetical protein
MKDEIVFVLEPDSGRAPVGLYDPIAAANPVPSRPTIVLNGHESIKKLHNDGVGVFPSEFIREGAIPRRNEQIFESRYNLLASCGGKRKATLKCQKYHSQLTN